MSTASPQPRAAVIVEDDPAVRDLLVQVFEAAGFTAVVRTHDPLITTLDVNLPGIDGFETARRVRAISDTYIVLVTAHADESDAVLGLSLGADDYVTKPFRPRELRARVEAMLRRPRALAPGHALPGAEASAISGDAVVAGAATGASETDGAAASPPGRSPAPGHPSPVRQPPVLAHRDLTLDTCTRVVQRGDAEIILTRTEFDLLRTLLESQRRARSKEDLALVVRGDEPVGTYVSDLDRRAIEAHIANLRRKIGDSVATPRYIETVRGVGYRLTLAHPTPR